MTSAEFEDAFRTHQDAVYRFAWRMTGSAAAAEDIAQDVFLTLLRQPDRFDAGRGPLRPFLLGIARNLALKRFRVEKGREYLDEQDDVRLAAMPMAVERLEVSQTVGLAVRSLPPLQREVLLLAEYDELALEEIARIVQAEVGTVKSRLHRARENLRQLLAPLKPAGTMRMTRHGTFE
jgi:RNA polymerase sigma-70 factor (ECF subfamily)